MRAFLNHRRGEIATVLTLLTVGLMAVGVMVGSRLAQQGPRPQLRAQTTNQVDCQKNKFGSCDPTSNCCSNPDGSYKFCYNECIPQSPGKSRKVGCQYQNPYGYITGTPQDDSKCGGTPGGEVWSCDSTTATESDKQIFNSTWCDGKARWLWEACGIGSEPTAKPPNCGGGGPPPGANCPLDHQDTTVSDSCGTCISNTAQLADFYDKNINSSISSLCSTTQMANHWCNGGVSPGGSDDCQAIKSAQCASACGSGGSPGGGSPPTPTPTPQSGGGGPGAPPNNPACSALPNGICLPLNICTHGLAFAGPQDRPEHAGCGVGNVCCNAKDNIWGNLTVYFSTPNFYEVRVIDETENYYITFPRVINGTSAITSGIPLSYILSGMQPNATYKIRAAAYRQGAEITDVTLSSSCPANLWDGRYCSVQAPYRADLSLTVGTAPTTKISGFVIAKYSGQQNIDIILSAYLQNTTTKSSSYRISNIANRQNTAFSLENLSQGVTYDVVASVIDNKTGTSIDTTTARMAIPTLCTGQTVAPAIDHTPAYKACRTNAANVNFSIDLSDYTPPPPAGTGTASGKVAVNGSIPDNKFLKVSACSVLSNGQLNCTPPINNLLNQTDLDFHIENVPVGEKGIVLWKAYYNSNSDKIEDIPDATITADNCPKASLNPYECLVQVVAGQTTTQDFTITIPDSGGGGGVPDTQKIAGNIKLSFGSLINYQQYYPDITNVFVTYRRLLSSPGGTQSCDAVQNSSGVDKPSNPQVAGGNVNLPFMIYSSLEAKGTWYCVRAGVTGRIADGSLHTYLSTWESGKDYYETTVGTTNLELFIDLAGQMNLQGMGAIEALLPDYLRGVTNDHWERAYKDYGSEAIDAITMSNFIRYALTNPDPRIPRIQVLYFNPAGWYDDTLYQITIKPNRKL